jgi:hypothetical protein
VRRLHSAFAATPPSAAAVDPVREREGEREEE